MDFKWLALFSFVVHLWPKLNVIIWYIHDADATRWVLCLHHSRNVMESTCGMDPNNLLHV